LTGYPLLIEASNSSPVPLDAYTVWIQGVFGSDPALTAKAADPDQDKASNWEEYVTQSQPNEASSRFTLQAIHGPSQETLLIMAPTFTNRLYALYFTTQAETATWTLSTQSWGTGSNLMWRISNGADRVFYRGGVTLPP
jgi:hypothetical protein